MSLGILPKDESLITITHGSFKRANGRKFRKGFAFGVLFGAMMASMAFGIMMLKCIVDIEKEDLEDDQEEASKN